MPLSAVLARRASGVVEDWGRLLAGREDTPVVVVVVVVVAAGVVVVVVMVVVVAAAVAVTAVATGPAEVSGIPRWGISWCLLIR